jgi:hypothetical protein
MGCLKRKWFFYTRGTHRGEWLGSKGTNRNDASSGSN